MLRKDALHAKIMTSGLQLLLHGNIHDPVLKMADFTYSYSGKELPSWPTRMAAHMSSVPRTPPEVLL